MKKTIFQLINKTLIIILAAITMNITANAQGKGDKSLGISLIYGSLINKYVDYNNAGIGTKYRYNLSRIVRLESSFNYLFEKDFVSSWDLFENLHILIPLNKQITIYPLAGIGVFGFKADYPIVTDEWGYSYDNSKSYTKLGFNFLGSGIDLKITDKLILNAEWCFKGEFLMNDARGPGSIFSAGINYKF